MAHENNIMCSKEQYYTLILLINTRINLWFWLERADTSFKNIFGMYININKLNKIIEIILLDFCFVNATIRTGMLVTLLRVTLMV